MQGIWSRFFPLALAASVTALGAENRIEFNRDIRPLLSDKCFACHGPDASHRKTKLRFDLESSTTLTLAGGRRAIVAGNPDSSEIIRRVSSSDLAIRMPPAYAKKDALNENEVDLLRRWIAEGAQWQPFWSFAPPRKPALPPVQQASWPRNPIDRFLLARMERENLHPAPEADPAILLRRVSLDLTGLPPDPSELSLFLADPTPAAYERAVDRLLASPRYGERMTFRWMEAARYGDTNGYQTDGARDMWRWRDWVIESFNRNLPWDRFITEQIAGDLLPSATLSQQIATGFNRNQRTSGEGGIIPEEYRSEYVADRAQTTATVFMGLTVGCARCHDHKFDPILQKDFYSLYAFFNQIPDEKGFAWNYGNEEPLVKAPLADQETKLAELDRNLVRARAAFVKFEPALRLAQVKWEKQIKNTTMQDILPAEGLVYASGPTQEQFDGRRPLESAGDKMDFNYLDPFSFSAWINPASSDGGILSHADDYFEGSGHSLFLLNGKLRLHLIFRWTDLGLRVESANALPLNRLQHVTVTYDGKRRAAGVRMYVDGVQTETRILFDQNNEPLRKPNTPFRIGAAGGKNFTGTIGEVRVYNRAITPDEAAALAVTESVATLATQAHTAAQRTKLALAFEETAAPAEAQSAGNAITMAERERDRFYQTIPTVMVMADSRTPRSTFILKRGAYDAPGEPVERATPAFLPPFHPEWPRNRLGLAYWLTAPENPLTARVTVNRFWQSFFGIGIVKTADDFGSQGEWPVHPELLDWLATTFVESGWDVKALQKTLVMSAAYRQSSQVTPELLARDPDNRLIARGPRFRLGPEVIRDQALAVSGLLVEKLGGPSVKPYQPAGLWQELAGGKGYVEDSGPSLYRRSLYTYWKRTVAPPFMVNFDSPNREQCTVAENRTNSPLQALNLMNDVTILEASRKLAERMMRKGGDTPESRLAWGYRAVLSRSLDSSRQEVLLRAYRNFSERYRRDESSARSFLMQGSSPQASDLDPVELAAYTAVSSLLLNLDDTISKQ